MRIKTLSYTNKATGWELKPISFGPLTLLVGASGVGKTRILESILDLKRISRGETLNGIKWSVEFSAASGHECKWEGEFENKGFSIYPGGDKEEPRIERECVYIDGKLVVDRNQDGIIFNGTRTVKLSSNESAISLLREEDKINDIYKEFDKIIFDNDIGSQLTHMRIFLIDEANKGLKIYKSIDAIRDCNRSTAMKLYFTYKNQRQFFGSIAQTFADIFPHVEAIKFEPLTTYDMGELLFIQIKEKGIKNWIHEGNISSGMLKTLMHIAELYLCPDSSVILIDEFENSLGINCIDEVTSSITSAERGLQFIITSHHPYIINNIHQDNWKIISRQGGSVIAHDASEFGFDKSKHEAFIQLINLDIYEEGVTS